MNNKSFYLVILSLLVLSVFFWIWMFQAQPSSGIFGEENVEVTMYRTDGCDCCLKWSDHLELNGFDVEVQAVENLQHIKDQHNVPADLSSCHTAVIDGYVVEGHVPVREIRKLIDERPESAGISVPGMPMGSPGMEGFRTDPYNVILFDDRGNQTVYARY